MQKDINRRICRVNIT